VDRLRPETLPLTRARRAAGGPKAAPSNTTAGGPKDKELEAGSRAHYEDPAYYTKTYRKREDDVAFYVALAEKHARTGKGRGAAGGPKAAPSNTAVLEYGAGNGRIALPLARAGFSVTALDLSRPMLDDFSLRLSAEPDAVRRRVKLRHGDMRLARLARRFDLVICPFNAFLHLYTRTDVERFLARVREHLSPAGVFAFDVSVPSAEEMARDPNRAYVCPRFRYPGTGEMIRYSERFDYDQARQILFVSMEFVPDGRTKASWVTPLAHRQFFPQEIEALLHYNGFDVDETWGDYKGGKLDRYSEVMVIAACCRRAARRHGARR
jgi:SAM-dependent methyltransferase